MAGRIRDEDKEAVRERVDIVKLVSGYLALKKAGHDSWVGICPFHPDKGPSLNISPSKGLYYCFGCGAGGDAFGFLIQIENLTFTEAVERLAEQTGVRLRYEAESPRDRKAASKRDSLQRANAEAASIFHRTLMDSPDAKTAREYLSERGIDGPTAERFQVGYAPSRGNALLRTLGARVSTEILMEAGLAVRDATGGVRDRFRERITFPIHDLSGRAVGFGARLLRDQDGQPKYLNTKETEVYDKSRLLYNLHRAKAAIGRTGEAYVVEGYTDVIALHQAGVESAVATCGTALGDAHLRMLSRFAQRAILAFDSDEAGARAAERAYQFHQDHPLELRVLILPEGLDPADFVRQKGADAFHDAVKRSMPLVRYMLDRSISRHDLSSVEARARAVDDALPLVAGLKDPVVREQYTHYLADAAGVSDTAVTLKLQRRDDGGGGGRGGRGENGDTGSAGAEPAAKRLSPQHHVEREMLRLVARDDAIYLEFAPKLTPDYFDRAQHRKLFDCIHAHKGDLRRAVGQAADDKLAGQLAALVTEPTDGDPTESYAHRVFYRLQEFDYARRIDALRKDLQPRNPMVDPQYDQMFAELSKLEGDRRRVRDQAEQM
jgi:DNA primase